MSLSPIDLLRTITTPKELTEFLHHFLPTVETISLLKDHAAQFHFSQPALAVQIAQKTYDLSLHLEPRAQALGAWCLGNSYLHNSQYIEAKQYLREARSFFLEIQEPLEAARLSVGLVGVMGYTGELQAALDLATEIEPILAQAADREPADLRRCANLKLNCGIVHELMGDYQESISVYQGCIELLKDSSEAHLIARATHNHGYALAQIGAFGESLAAYEQAEKLFNTANSTTDLVRLHINRCHVLMLLGRYEEAISTEEQIRHRLQEQPELEQALPRLTILRTQLYLSTGEQISQEVIDELHTTEEVFAAHGPMIEDGLTWLLLGRCYSQIGRMDEARHCYRQVLHLVEQGADRSLDVWAYHGLAAVEEKELYVDKAAALYQTSIDRLEAIRNELQIETLRASYLNDKLDVYRDLAALYLDQKRLPDAFQVTDRAKARIVSEKLATRLSTEVTKAVRSVDKTVRTLAQQLQRELTQLESAYGSARAAQVTDTDSTDLTLTITRHEKKVQELIGEIQRQQPIFSTLTTGQSVTVEEIQRQLGDTIFLQYHVLKDRFSVFILASDGIKAHVQLGRVSDVFQAQQAYSTAVQGLLGLLGQVGFDRVARRLPNFLDAANKHLATLHDLLFRPLSEIVPQNGPLIISPDSFLHAVPFHALYDGQDYLVERHTISYAPSAAVVDYCQRQVPSGRNAFLIGYDDSQLAAVKSELQQLAQQYPTATLKLGADATTETFVAHAPHHRLIHVAAHAAFRHDKPMLSSIQLADRRLTLAEISRQPLNADLITLSGCETGAGQIRGTDILSLASGFLGAGTRSLLVSLWRVEDTTTAQLMTEFYKAVQKGSTYAEALSIAQRALLAIGKETRGSQRMLQHPVFWAPFVLIGGR